MLFTEVVPHPLWWGSLPDNPGLLRGLAIDELYDLSDPDGDSWSPILEGTEFHKSTMLDDEDFHPDDFAAVAASVSANVAAGRRTFVHCTFGKNRSGLVIALVLRELEGLTGEQALERVRDLRLNAVNNPAYASWLVALGAPGEHGDRVADAG